MWQEISMYKIQLPHKTSMQYFLTEHYDGRKKKNQNCVQCRIRCRLLERLMHQKTNILALSITLTFGQILQCLPV